MAHAFTPKEKRAMWELLAEMGAMAETVEAAGWVVCIQDTETWNLEFVGPFTDPVDAMAYGQKRIDGFNSVEPSEPPLACMIYPLNPPDDD